VNEKQKQSKNEKNTEKPLLTVEENNSFQRIFLGF